MAITSRTVTVTTAVIRLDAAASAYSHEASVIVVNTDPTITLYVGGPAVTTAAGTPVAPGASLSVPLHPDEDDALYGRTASGSIDVRVLETGI